MTQTNNYVAAGFYVEVRNPGVGVLAPRLAGHSWGHSHCHSLLHPWAVLGFVIPNRWGKSPTGSKVWGFKKAATDGGKCFST